MNQKGILAGTGAILAIGVGALAAALAQPTHSTVHRADAATTPPASQRLTPAALVPSTAPVPTSRPPAKPTPPSTEPTPPSTEPTSTTPVPNAAPERPRRTELRTFVAYPPSGRLTVPIQARGGGCCYSASDAVQSGTAYRCFMGDQILDPCFAPPNPRAPREVACVPNPWTGAPVLSLSRPLPARGRVNAEIWALQLANGARCVAVTGTVETVDGVRMDYGCANGGMAGIESRGASSWTVRFMANPRSGPTVPSHVAVAWRAG